MVYKLKNNRFEYNLIDYVDLSINMDTIAIGDNYYLLSGDRKLVFDELYNKLKMASYNTFVIINNSIKFDPLIEMENISRYTSSTGHIFIPKENYSAVYGVNLYNDELESFIKELKNRIDLYNINILSNLAI